MIQKATSHLDFFFFSFFNYCLFFLTISGGYNLKQNNSLNFVIKFQTVFEKNDVIFICCFQMYVEVGSCLSTIFAFSAISYNSSQFLKLVNEIDLSMCTLYRFHSNTQVSFKHPFFVHCGVFNSLNQFLINFLRSQNQINLIEYWIKITS